MLTVRSTGRTTYVGDQPKLGEFRDREIQLHLSSGDNIFKAITPGMEKSLLNLGIKCLLYILHCLFNKEPDTP